jgi:hypothetical protein
MAVAELGARVVGTEVANVLAWVIVNAYEEKR